MYEIILIICVFVTFLILLFNVILNKKCAFLSFSIFILLALLVVIKRFDLPYYTTMFSSIENFELYSAISGGINVFLALVEFFIGRNHHKKKAQKNKEKKEPTPNAKEIVRVTQNDDLLVYLELINEPMACLVNNNYLLNMAMKKVLKIDKNVISINEMLNLINIDDKTLFLNGKEKIFKFINDEALFEEVTTVISNKEYKMIRMLKNINANKVKIYTFKELNKEIEYLITKQQNFALLIFNITNFVDIGAKYGKDYADVAVSKYLVKLHNLKYLPNIKMYYIGTTEYLILINEVEYLVGLMSNLENGTSGIITSTDIIGKENVTITSKVGIVASDKISNLTVDNVIKACFDTLQIACQKDYYGDYCIYTQTPDELDYSLKDLNVDVNIDLGKYKDRLK